MNTFIQWNILLYGVMKIWLGKNVLKCFQETNLKNNHTDLLIFLDTLKRMFTDATSLQL